MQTARWRWTAWLAFLVGGSRVEVRSISRVGRSDVGAHARRIRDYLPAFTKERPRYRTSVLCTSVL